MTPYAAQPGSSCAVACTAPVPASSRITVSGFGFGVRSCDPWFATYTEPPPIATVRGLSPTENSPESVFVDVTILPTESESGLATQTVAPSSLIWIGDVCRGSAASAAAARGKGRPATAQTVDRSML